MWEVHSMFQYFSFFLLQYGGNPVSCAVALAVIQVIEDEDLRGNAIRVGDYICQQSKQLQKKHKIIGDIRWVLVGLNLLVC